MRRISPRTMTAGVGVVATAFLAGCTNAQPAPQPSGLEEEPVRILADDSVEQQVIGEIYRGVLNGSGREAELVSAGDVKQDPAKEPNFWFGCTGQLLNEFDPAKARELEREYNELKDGNDDTDFLEVTHVELIGSLTPELITVDPAPAELCEDSDNEVELPNNLVPVFDKTLLGRETARKVGEFTKFITNDELDELLEDVEKSDSLQETVGEWLRYTFPSAEMGANEDSDSSDGESGFGGSGSDN